MNEKVIKTNRRRGPITNMVAASGLLYFAGRGIARSKHNKETNILRTW